MPAPSHGKDTRNPYEQERASSHVTYEQFVSNMVHIGCSVMRNEDIEAVINSAWGRALMRHDGKITYAVRATHTAEAEQVMTNGLVIPGRVNYPDAPDLWTVPTVPSLSQRAVLLAGPSNPQQAEINAYALAYRFVTGHIAKPTDSSAKIVFAFPFSTDGNGSELAGVRAFDETPLARASDTYIQLEDEHDLGTYRMPERFAFGYLNLDTGGFVKNPNFDFA